MKHRCEQDNGNLFSKFVRSWFVALGHVSAEKDYTLPMLLLVMDTLKIDNLAYEPVVTLNSMIAEQVANFNFKSKCTKWQLFDFIRGTSGSVNKWHAILSSQISTTLFSLSKI